ncbi:trehalase family glycosidase [Aquimarina gracilis]|uniref:Trehalase family glycosidase n=1 Tax=Aquimarina gracilis TaxID=874422 RepID=A0ABU5ZNZ3_9FLAO|nr:trehalase family glycosidase [Aquimarina gracilis]MEB3343871.1 trehalase family glycosidase [Aquimarina gracilis]
MNPRLIFIIITIIGYNSNFSQSIYDSEYYNSLTYTHDLNLPNWGPYTKKYIGVSHIPDIEKGIRFDLSVFPGFYRRKVDVPHVFYESGFHPWEASPNLEYFSFRHELEWKDRVYTDISYSKIDQNSRLIRIECINNTAIAQNIVIHMMGSIHFPSIKAYDPYTPIQYSTIKLPSYATWIDAIDYKEIKFAKPSHKDQLVYDGKLRGEIRDHGLVNGSGIGKRFGKKEGDQVRYEFEITTNINNAFLWVRYKIKDDQKIDLELDGIVNKRLHLSGNGSFKTEQIEIGNLKSGKYGFRIISKGKSPIIIDGFTIIDKKDTKNVEVKPIIWQHTPNIINGPIPNSIILKYKNIDTYYGISWDYPDYEVREWKYKDLDDSFKRMVNDHVKTKFDNGTNGHFTNIFLKPIHIQPKSSFFINGIVCYGSKEEVTAYLNKKIAKENIQSIYNKARSNLFDYPIVPAGETYLFSQKRMAATTFCNVVYPVYTQKEYIKHHTPGRFWDSLYTWDSGFIGLGMMEQDIKRGIESLNAYLNEEDEQSAFIHHGTLLPVQHYLFLELWNKTQSEELLKVYYPKLKRYYEFLVGINKGSTTRMKSNLIRTWDYFYNSGGWDDYPPQKYIHQEKIKKNVVPVVNTAHSIRVAKILQMAASYLNFNRDVKAYEKDIQNMSKALQSYSWDKKSGYFGYVVHDENQNPTGILKFDDNVNFNMGLGGAYPLVSGVCTKNQKNLLLKKMKTKRRLWSDIGLSAVDQSAPYYSGNGYWNGTVWMPHQWFFWKTMLDIGEADFAKKIAKTALDLWKKEVENTYNCYEHFIIKTKRGAGWHQFSGLSTPVLSWFNAYYQQGNLTTGFNIWVEEKKVDKTYSSLKAILKVFDTENEKFSLIACLNPNFEYQVFWNNEIIPHKEINAGTLSISIPNKLKKGVLTIKKLK